MLNATQIAKAIKEYRLRNGMTLERLAQKSRMQLKQLWLLENERVKQPTVKSIHKLMRSGVLPKVEQCAGTESAN